MGKADIIALVVTSVIGLIVLVLSIILLSGRGSCLIAGFNNASKEQKEKYDKRKLSKFMGFVILPVAFLFPLIAVGGCMTGNGYLLCLSGLSLLCLVLR